jgi:anti-sigma-K factor RskA
VAFGQTDAAESASPQARQSAPAGGGLAGWATALIVIAAAALVAVAVALAVRCTPAHTPISGSEEDARSHSPSEMATCHWDRPRIDDSVITQSILDDGANYASSTDEFI